MTKKRHRLICQPTRGTVKTINPFLSLAWQDILTLHSDFWKRPAHRDRGMMGSKSSSTRDEHVTPCRAHAGFFLILYLFVSPFPFIPRRIFMKPSLLLWLVLVYLSFIYIVMCFRKAVVSPTKASNALRNQFKNVEKHGTLYWSTGSCFRKLWMKSCTCLERI